MKRGIYAVGFLLLVLFSDSVRAYPIDGFSSTGIRRLAWLQTLVDGTAPGPLLTVGQKRSIDDIHLQLVDAEDPVIDQLPPPDTELQARLDTLFGSRDPSYGLALLDITPGRPVRYAARQADRLFPPGSIGKLAIAAGLFAELARRFPDDVTARARLLVSQRVVADEWIVYDEHDVPLFNPVSGAYEARPIRVGDEFSLYEWVDHMLSASANSAASVVWKELVLMRHYGDAYPPTLAEEGRFFRETPKARLTQLAMPIVSEPLRAAGISESQFKLGSFFTRTGKQRVPGVGSGATPQGLLTYLLRLEQGRIVDPWSSLEIKRLMYMTAKRIRYASSPQIARSRVYFKSGSLYRCQPEEGFRCGKYLGNAENVMNSVATVETSDGRVYLVALTSNVLKKNSAVDHQEIAGDIEVLMRP